MIGPIIRYTALAAALLLLAVMLTGYWVLETASGTRWLWNRAANLVPGDLRAESVAGSLGDGLILTGLSYSNDAVELVISEARIAANFVLVPLTVNVAELEADGVAIQRKETAEEDEPGEPILERLALPLRINVERVVLGRLEVLGAAGEQLFALESAGLAGSWHDEIVLTRFELRSDSHIGEIGGSAQLGLQPPHSLVADIDAAYPLRVAEDQVFPLTIAAVAEGTLDELRIDIASSDPDVRIVGNLLELTAEPGWDVRVVSPYFQWPLAAGADETAVYLRNADLQTSGHWSGYDIAGSGLVSVAGIDEQRFVLDSDGDPDGLDIRHLQLLGNLLEAALSGELRWTGGFAVAAEADIARLNVNELTPEFPPDRPVAGTVDARWTAGKAVLNEVQLTIHDAPTRLNARGEIDVDGGVVHLDLAWQDLGWPLEGESSGPPGAAMRLLSEQGRLSVSGSPDQWTFDGRIALEAADLPRGLFLLSGTGDREGVAARLHESEVLGGNIAGEGSYQWGDGGRWSARLQTENLSIGPLFPEFSGRINSSLTTEGQVSPLEFAVDILQLDGNVRDRPLEGRGSLRFRDGNLSAERLRIASGDATLQADGSLGSRAGLDFRLEVAAMEAFHPDIAGFLQASGNVSTIDDFPALRIDLIAEDVIVGDWTLDRLTVTSAGDRDEMPVALTANGAGLSLGTREVSGFSLELAAAENRQELQLSVTADDESIGLELAGAFENWRRPLESAWTGELLGATFDVPGIVRYQLRQPAEMTLAAGRVNLGQACLDGNAQSSVCLEAGWVSGAGFDLAAQMTAVPARMLAPLHELDLEFTQTLDGSLTVSGDADNVLSGEGLIDILPGRIRSREDPRIATETGAGQLQFALDNGQLLSGRLVLPFSDAAQVDGRFEVTDVGLGADSAIDGELKINLNDIAVAANILPMIDAASGRLDVDIEIGGTLGHPLLLGEAALSDGSFHYPPIGLQLSEIELQSVIREDNRIELRSTFRAGEGRGELRSTAATIDGLREGLELYLRGDNLTLIDLPDVNVIANVDMAVGIERESLRLNGNILVPRARLSPVEVTADKVSQSEDVVIVSDRDDDVAPASADTEPPFQINGTVVLVLGDDVKVDLGAAEARLSGNSAFHWSGPPVPTANGHYNIAGRFEAYGQLLEITEGAIQFPGIPATNANLRVRAEREIFGNPQIRSAGVLVTGTIRDPVVDVYTNPPTTRERAVTLLVTGSDFDYEQGVGAVDVGTYISRNLYISYGIGLFDRANVISVRYDIARGFGIKATSGRRAEGIDLSYTIER